MNKFILIFLLLSTFVFSQIIRDSPTKRVTGGPGVSRTVVAGGGGGGITPLDPSDASLTAYRELAVEAGTHIKILSGTVRGWFDLWLGDGFAGYDLTSGTLHPSVTVGGKEVPDLSFGNLNFLTSNVDLFRSETNGWTLFTVWKDALYTDGGTYLFGWYDGSSNYFNITHLASTDAVYFRAADGSGHAVTDLITPANVVENSTDYHVIAIKYDPIGKTATGYVPGAKTVMSLGATWSPSATWVNTATYPTIAKYSTSLLPIMYLDIALYNTQLTDEQINQICQFYSDKWDGLSVPINTWSAAE